ncbi:MAG: hypothetical protein WCQ50_14910 [Spirochaetota bacterium]
MLPEELRKDIEFTFQEMDREFETTAPLFVLARQGELDAIYTMAAAAVLHSVYNAIESAFAMIQKRIDGRITESGQWHRLLLDSMATPSAKRSAVISPECRDFLRDYLAFRHRFRHGYGWSLDPVKVAAMLNDLPRVANLAKYEILAFLDREDASS